MTLRATALLGLVLAAATAVGPLGVAPAVAQEAAALRATYDLYAAGMSIASAEATLSLSSTGYRMDFRMRTSGLVGFFVRGDQHTTVEGTWDGDRPLPRVFHGSGVWRGEERVALIEYDHGQPQIRRLIPPNAQEREDVPPPLRQGTIDSLSAAIELIRHVARVGNCDGEARLYDGRRVSTIAARTVREEILPPHGRTGYTGRALRCDFEGRVVAGFRLADDEATRRRPLNGTAWMARPVDGAPPIPVQLTFETRWFGTTTMYLTSVSPIDAPPPVPQMEVRARGLVSPAAAATAPRSQPSR